MKITPVMRRMVMDAEFFDAVRSLVQSDEQLRAAKREIARLTTRPHVDRHGYTHDDGYAVESIPSLRKGNL